MIAAGLFSVAFVVACGESVNEEESIPGTATGTGGGVLPPTATSTPPGNEFPIVGQPEPFFLEDLALVGLDGWINSEPLAIQELLDSNQIVLLDFWTYTCVNCIRTFPYLSAWHEAYSKYGLTVIGVHSPEFDFEKIPENVQKAVVRYNLKYPIALDSEKQTWDKYGNRFWPSKYLIDGSGEVIFRHFGEGGYRETELLIRETLEAEGRDLDDVAWSSVVGPARSQGAFTVTRELYGGYSDNYLSDGLYAGQDAYYVAPDSVVDYVDDGTRRHGQFFLDGQWINESTAVVSGNSGKSEYASIAFDFFANSVNAVIDSSSGVVDIVVELDGRPLAISEAGPDIEWDDNGDSVLEIGDARLYQIIELSEFGKHELRLKTNSEGIAIYSFTFGVFEFGP